MEATPTQASAEPSAALEEHAFVFFSTLLDKTVVDAHGFVVGRLTDLAVSVAHTFPPVVAFVVQRGRFEPFPLTGRWGDVVSISGSVVRLAVGIQALTPSKLDTPGEILLREALLDRQIVDMDGAKVVRVNDVHFLRIGSAELHMVHVDVGTRGLVRRMGWQDGIDGIVRRVAPKARYLTAERLIRWQYVQPLSLDAKAHTIRLSLQQKQLSELHPADIAEILTDLDGRERATVFRSLDPETAADALAEVEDPRIQSLLLDAVSQEEAADILEEMQPDEAADLLGELPHETSSALLRKMEVEDAEDVRELLTYAPDTAGGMMTTELVALPAELTIEDAFARLRQAAPDVEQIYYIFVVDDDGHLVGVLSLRQLILAHPPARLRDVMIENPARVHHTDSRDSVAEIVEKYELLALPVVDDGDILVGMITVDDVLSHIASQAWKSKLGR